MQCPECQGTHVVKNGSIHNGKPKWKCKACGRQFVAEPAQHRVSDETKQTIDTLRQRCSRFVRKMLVLEKAWQSHRRTLVFRPRLERAVSRQTWYHYSYMTTRFLISTNS